MMKTLFLVLILMSISKFSLGHQYFFGFAELEYNRMQESFEGTLILSAHDLEDVLIEKGVISTKLDQLKHDSTSIAALGNELFTTFKLSSKNKQIILHAQDFFLTKNGLIEIYFKSEIVKLENEFEIDFFTLMEEFPQQQNKVTFICNGKKQTAVFLKDETKKKITL